MLFCGSGSTAAIDTLIRLLEPSPGERPVVFIGPYEHHSNELVWRESIADVVTIGESPTVASTSATSSASCDVMQTVR